MLKLHLELTRSAVELGISGLSRGHMTVSGSLGTITSQEKQPDQSMMIYPSVILLLDGVRRFLSQKTKPDYRFVGVDSSFQFVITQAEGRVRIHNGQIVVDEVSDAELVQAVWQGVDVFVTGARPKLPPDDVVADDLHAALTSFVQAFKA